MPSHRRIALMLVFGICGLAAAVLTAFPLFRVHCEPLMQNVLADGRFHNVARLRRSAGPGLVGEKLSTSGTGESSLQVHQESNGTLNVLYRAPVKGGNIRLRLLYDGHVWTVPLSSAPDWTDHVGDGLPDALRLHDAEDRLRFRLWFTSLADQAASLRPGDLPAEVTDCSALLRYSYRLALVRHDDAWYKQFAPGTMPALPSVEQWNYPDTALGAALFRVTPLSGTPAASDFAQFADAKTLYLRNSFRVGRDVRLARPGDLLFFHQLERNQQYHSMIVTGEGAAWVVYHTGPSGTAAARTPGEMRRAPMTDLLQHPDPRWRPTADNSNFLGVYRWNLLRED